MIQSVTQSMTGSVSHPVTKMISEPISDSPSNVSEISAVIGSMSGTREEVLRSFRGLENSGEIPINYFLGPYSRWPDVIHWKQH